MAQKKATPKSKVTHAADIVAANLNLLALLQASLMILGKLFGKSLTTAWIFQHATINEFDTDKTDQLSALFAKLGSKSLKAVYQMESVDKLFTIKQWTMISMIARGAKSSDFSDDKTTQAMIDALVSTVNKSMHFDKLDVPTKAEKTGTGQSKSAKRSITVK